MKPSAAFEHLLLATALLAGPSVTRSLSAARTQPAPHVLASPVTGVAIGAIALATPSSNESASIAAVLPAGVEAVWDLAKAEHETTPTRERICLNGLWQWRPAEPASEQVPTEDWGYFKVPGSWPGITDYMQKDCQTVFAHPRWRDRKLANLAAAWYQREITIPPEWAGRRVAVSAEYLNSYAAVYVDGRRAGEIRFPGGEVDLTATCPPGAARRLSLLVVALPLKGVMLSYTDSASARQVQGSVARRGLCGDVYLVGVPTGPRLGDVRVETSVRRRSITLSVALEAPDAEAHYRLRARISRNGSRTREFTGPRFAASDLRDGRITLTQEWLPNRLWDLHTPGNTPELAVTLQDAAGKVLDAGWPVRFGFREFWIDGRDFFLNGTRLFLSAVPLDNAQVGAALATYDAARESLTRLKSLGINFVYTHNYGCEPGSHLGFEEILRAADDVGMLVGFSQPHFSHYDWPSDQADRTNGYARHAAFYVQAARNHPSVVMYAMSHNATGYEEDMNPDLIDGVHDPRESWGLRNARLALRAEAIVRRLDPSRIVYHHASGNLGSMHAINFYPNFVPTQELSDWFEHWATTGVKPVFLCEYGAPFTWDWTMYRGWFRGQREFGSAVVPWEFCVAEWNAQFQGDRAYQLGEPERANLRWEAAQFRAGRLWHRWDYPYQVGSPRFEQRYPVFAAYLTDNWRAFRTWGVSAISPWEYEHFWTPREGVDRRRKELPVDWQHLQRPGFSPDYLGERYERMDLAFERSDWIPTLAAQALLRNNRPLLAYVAGQAGRFTSKDHDFLAGDRVEKQLVVLNNSRQTVTCDCEWSVDLSPPAGGVRHVRVPTGQQERIPFAFTLPDSLPPGTRVIKARFQFGTGEVQTDSFSIDVLARPATPQAHARIALFDPRGETASLLQHLGVRSESIDAGADLSGFDLLLVGKSALTVDGPAPDFGRVKTGLKVILFEQTAAVLEKRLGFRIAEYGLRQVFPRVPQHPVLRGLAAGQLRDWRGEATLTEPRLKYELRPRYGPTVTWCGLPVTRLWRCGNRGNVASVLIEKPACGDFLPLVEGGYSLQYSPLLEFREGRGMILFCQLDVTGRTEVEPAATTLVGQLLEYAVNWKPQPRRAALYAGDPAGRGHLEAAGITASPWTDGDLSPDQVLIVGPGGGRQLAGRAGNVAAWLGAGGHLVAVGLDQENAEALLPSRIALHQGEHIATWFEPPDLRSPLAGVGPAEVHNRDPRELPLVAGGARVLGDGVLGFLEQTNVVFCQLVPWEFGGKPQGNLRRTFRRSSVLLSRLIANAGVESVTPLLERLHQPVDATRDEKRWLKGFYLDSPEEWDDPYRFFRW